MDTSEPLTGVGRTALGVARARARESRRPDRLFADPYAAAFVEAAGVDAGGATGTPDPGRVRLAFHAVIRTRFYDDYLLAAGSRQVVLLAAGLDARAFRLPWPDGTRVFELDLPPVLAFKEKVLAAATPRCERIVIGADLRAGWADRLTEAGFDPAEPTAWLAEGLILYLTPDEATALLDTVGRLSAPGSRLAFERGDATGRVSGAEAYTSLWKGGLGPDAADRLTRTGWRPESHDLVDLAASYGRPVSSTSRSGFLTATRQ